MYTQNEFKKLVVEKNTTLEAISYILGINRTTLYRRLKGGLSRLTIKEAKTISSYLRLTAKEAERIFWGH